MKAVKFLALMFVIFLMVENSCATAATKNPVRIARLPIILQNNRPDYNARMELEMKIARSTNVPLNGTLQVAEYIATKDSTVAMNEIWQSLHAVNKHVKVADTVKILADRLDADLVICPVIRRYSQSITTPANFNADTHLAGNVSAELVVYDRRTDILLDKKTSRSYTGSYSRYGTAAYLAGECFDELIAETELRQIIRAIGR